MLKLHVEKRTEKGKSFSRKLRINDKFPGILYGSNEVPILLTLDHNTVFNLQKKIGFYQDILLLIIKEQIYKVKVQAIQRHAFKLKLLHIDFLCIK